jgi:hypothetical protein
MASFTGATPIDHPSRFEIVAYQPLMPGSGGGDTFEPKRYLCVDVGVWVPIQ